MQVLPHIYLIGSQDCFLTYTDWYSPDCEYVDCNVFAVNLGREIILFDSGNGVSMEQIRENLCAWELDPKRITHCFLTHSHFDHAGGAHYLKEHSVMIAAHSTCADAINMGDERTGSYLYHRPFPVCEADIIFKDEDSIRIGDLTINVYHSPGHAEGSVVYSFQWGERQVFVTGDLVAESGSLGWDGSIDFNPTAYIDSLKHLAKMDVDVLLPGHRRPALALGRIWVEQALNKALIAWGKHF